jgi:hypothetical protein
MANKHGGGAAGRNKLGRWKKGTSGNPSGNTKLPANLPIDVLVAQSVNMKRLVRGLLSRAYEGDTTALTRVLDAIHRTQPPTAEREPLDLSPLTSEEVAIFSELVRKARGQSSEVDWSRIDLLMRSHGRHSVLTTPADVDDDGQDDGEE